MGSSSEEPSQSVRSPRKRMRSPTAQPCNPYLGCHKAQAKISTEEDKFGDEIDELDLIGTAALEQYESTQQENPMQNTTSNQSIPSSNSIPTQHSRGTDHKFSWEERNSQVAIINSTINEVPLPTFTNSKRSTTTGAAADHNNDLEEKVLYLQEQNYTNDGEVKVLRGEKKRLQRELQRKDEQLNLVQMQLISEKRARELSAAKEKDSLITRLQFKEQELLALKEKCSELERMHQQQQCLPSKTNPLSQLPTKSQPLRTSRRTATKKIALYQMKTSHGGFTSTTSESDTEFLSTETFIPLSQLNAGVATGINSLVSVPAGSSRFAYEDHQILQKGSTRARDSCSKTKSRAGRSRSISPSVVDKKIMKRKSLSARDSEPICMSEKTLGEKSDGIYALQSNLTPPCGDKVTEASHQPFPFPLPIVKEEPPFVIYVPGRELDSSTITMLLINPDLLKSPALIPPALSAAASSAGKQHSLPPQAHSGRTGLLSLLCLEAKHFPSFFSTPVPANLCSPSASPLLPSSSSLAISPSSMRTPSRKQRLIPLKPHTLAKTNMAQGRIRHSSGLLKSAKMKSLSVNNTPYVAPPLLRPQDSLSGSLISSISSSSLHHSIGGLLASSEISRFSSLCQDVRGTRMNRGEEGLHCDSGHRDLLEIFHQVGNLIIRYYGEQKHKVRSLQTSTISSSLSEGSGESLDTSLLISPRSSSKSSTSSEFSSSTSNEFCFPVTGNQKLLSIALKTLEILISYRRQISDLIFLEPPPFAMDSHSASSPGVSLSNPSSSDSVSVEVAPCIAGEDKMAAEGEEDGVDGGRGGEEGGVKETTKMSTLARVSHRLISLRDPDSKMETNSSLKDSALVS